MVGPITSDIPPTLLETTFRIIPYGPRKQLCPNDVTEKMNICIKPVRLTFLRQSCLMIGQLRFIDLRLGHVYNLPVIFDDQKR